MRKFDIRIGRKQTEAVVADKRIYLNYCPADTAFAYPVKDLLESGHWDYVDSEAAEQSGNDQDLHMMGSCETVVNIVTDDFLSDSSCVKISQKAFKKKKRCISISLLEDDARARAELGEAAGEIIPVPSYQDVSEYLLFSLYNEEPFKSFLGQFSNKLYSVLDPVLNGLTVPPDLEIGADDNSVILAVGSAAYSTIRMWTKQGYKIKSKLVMVQKSEYVKGQPDITNAKKWYINIVNDDKQNGDLFIKNLKSEIKKGLVKHVGRAKKLVILGGLGKTTASFLIPHLVAQANKMNIDTSIVCTLPFQFDSNQEHRIAAKSFEVIKRISEKTYVYDGSSEDRFTEAPNMRMNDLFCLIGYALAVSVNVGFNESGKNIREIVISRGEDDLRENDYKEIYGMYDIIIRRCS